MVSKLQTEVDPKVLTLLIEKSNEAKKKLDDAKEAHIVTGKQIGRASCRERVCQYV